MTDERVPPPLVQAHPFLVHIDHVGIHVDDPAALFRFFAEDLGLPVAFPFTTYPAYSSGSVSLGTMFLELMRFGRPRRRTVVQGQACYHILGFLVRPGALPAAVTDLGRRGIARSGILPVFAPDATEPDPAPLWENV